MEVTRALVAVFAFVALGCSVDTELGLEATIASTSVTVTSGDIVNVTMTVDYRVGAYADADRTFQPQAIELLVGEDSIVTLVPARPSGFDGTVSPGESLTATFDAGESGATDPRRMCGQEVAVIFRWIDRRVGDDLTMMMLGAAESSTTDVTCE